MNKISVRLIITNDEYATLWLALENWFDGAVDIVKATDCEHERATMAGEMKCAQSLMDQVALFNPVDFGQRTKK